MCEWGTDVELMLPVAAHLSRTGERYMKRVAVDACIASIVRALNEAGIETVASCCGHGRGLGNIALADGRELIVAPDYDTGRAIDRAFPPRCSPEKGGADDA